MVGSSLTPDDRRRLARRLKIGFVLLVAASAGIVAFRAGATPRQLAGALLGGLIVGAGLTWFVARNLRRIQPEGIDRLR